MTLSKFEVDTINRLASTIRREQPSLTRYDDYYNAQQKLEQLGFAVPPALNHFNVIVSWPQVVADTLAQRITLNGFRLPGKLEFEQDLWKIWQANNLDEESALAHLDAIIYGRAYICVGSNEDDPSTPLITVESPLEMTAEISPRTKKVSAALRYYKDTTEEGYTVDRAVLYLPNVTIWAEKKWSGLDRGWIETDRDEHNLGRVPVIPLTNRARTNDRAGKSEIATVIGVTDAASRALTLAQLATEVLSVPQRAILGVKEEDFVDEDGNPIDVFKSYFASVWALENSEAKVHQFTPADLGNFAKILEQYAATMSSITGLPLRYFGQNQANPASEGAIVADEDRLVKKAERCHVSWGGAWEEVMRIVKLITDGDIPEEWKSLEVDWADPSTPTEAQKADAITKKVTAGILPIEAAWEDLGFTPTYIEKLRKLRDKDMANVDVMANQLLAYRQGVVESPGANTAIADSPVAPGAE